MGTGKIVPIVPIVPNGASKPNPGAGDRPADRPGIVPIVPGSSRNIPLWNANRDDRDDRDDLAGTSSNRRCRRCGQKLVRGICVHAGCPGEPHRP